MREVKPLLLSAHNSQNNNNKTRKGKSKSTAKSERKYQQSTKVGGDLRTGFKMEIIWGKPIRFITLGHTQLSKTRAVDGNAASNNKNNNKKHSEEQ